MECLLKLRECCIAKKVPKLVSGEETVVMGGKQYPVTAKTAWRSTTTVPAQYYDLQTLLLLLEMKDARVGEYIRAATSRKLNFVSNVHRTDLLEYLQGNSDSSAHIEAAAVPDIGLVGAALGAPQRSSSSSGEPPSAKRPRTNDSSTSTSGTAAGSSSSSSSARRSSLTEDQLRNAKQKHAERLGGRGGSARGAGLILGSDSSAAAGSAASASALGMSSDKLLELRTKRLAQKRSTFSLEAGGDDPLENDEDAPVDPAFLDADREIVGRITAREARVTDRNAVLRRPGKDFKFALEYYTEVRRKEKEEAAVKDGSKPATGTAGSSSDKKRGRTEHPGKAFGFGAPPAPQPAAPSGPPIIIVPSVQTAILTLSNAKLFLEQGKFVSSAEALKAAGAERKPTELLIERTLPSGKQLVYKLVDNPTRLRPREWEQVVCVVVQGAAWQFKGWVYDQPVKLFDYALGVHFKYDDTALDKRVSDWNVKVLEINKYKRYQDTNSSLEFWRLLDSFMMVNKTNMLGGR